MNGSTEAVDHSGEEQQALGAILPEWTPTSAPCHETQGRRQLLNASVFSSGKVQHVRTCKATWEMLNIYHLTLCDSFCEVNDQSCLWQM